MHTADETAYWSEDTLILSSGAGGKEPTSQCWRCKRCVFDPWVRKIPLEKEMAIRSSVLAWEIPCMDRGAWWGTVLGVTESDVTEERNNKGRDAGSV